MFGAQMAQVGAQLIGEMSGNEGRWFAETYGSGANYREAIERERQQRQIDDATFQRQNYGADMLARAEAARAAGFHPTLGLSGGHGAAISPVVSGMSSRSGGYSAAYVPLPDPDEQRMKAAQADLAELSVIKAWRALAEQPGNGSAGVSGGGQVQVFPLPEDGQIDVRQLSKDNIFQEPGSKARPGQEGLINYKASEIPSTVIGDTSQAAGIQPFWSEYQLGRGGFKMLLPRSEEGPSESLESIRWYMWPAIVAANINHYGPGWIFGFSELKPSGAEWPSHLRSGVRPIRRKKE